MSHLISRISFKIFAIVLAAMLSISIYFSAVTYSHAVKHARVTEFKILKSIATTFAAQLESNAFIKVTAKDHVISRTNRYNLIRENIEASLFAVNRINGLKSGISVVLIHPNTGQMDWIGEKSIAHNSVLKKIISADSGTTNGKSLNENIEGIKESNQILFTYPISLVIDSNYKGYVIALEDVGKQLANARKNLYLQGLIWLMVLTIIGFVGYRMLRKVLRHEVFSKKKLQEYAELAKERNKELETLSTVLQKSENLILLTDNSGKIEWINEVYQKKNNYNEDELENFVGKELAEVSHYPRINEIIEEINSKRKKLVYEAKSYDNAKNEFWASTTVTPILSKDGNVEKLLFIDADITRLKRAEKEIEQMANFVQEDTRPMIRIHSDFTVLYSNSPGQSILNYWNTRKDQKIQKNSVKLAIQKAMLSEEEQTLNLAVENRLYRLDIIPVCKKDYVNIYGEDITEIQLAEAASRKRTLQLEEHNLSITDSINYARRIQEAILPSEDHIRKFFKNSFALNKPKDIVSGDFFWIHELVPQEEYMIALADCTGHGVPGAMMSILCHSLLNDIVERDNTKNPAAILTELNREIIRALRQKSMHDTSDGMDVSILHINLKKLEINFSGAYQHVYWMNGKLNIFKGDRYPIGGLYHDTNRVFTNHTFRASKGDSLYLLSDGYVDQFGGPKNKKFLSRRFAELIENSHRYSMQAQSFIYNKTFEEWRGVNDQVDDVSLIGIKF